MNDYDWKQEPAHRVDRKSYCRYRWVLKKEIDGKTLYFCDLPGMADESDVDLCLQEACQRR